MKRALALETSGRVGSVALAEDGRLLAEEQFPHGLRHAAKILTVIDSLCRARAWQPADLNELYVSIGPGSFTGLRIGITVARTMALATKLKIVAVPTVAVLVRNAPADARHVIIVLDAKRGQIFTARFERTESGWTEREPAHLDTLAAMLTRSPRPVHLVGEGLPHHDKQIADQSVLLTPPPSWRARAGAVADLGWEMSRQGKFTDPLLLLPLYVRLPEAEEKFNAVNPRSAPPGSPPHKAGPSSAPSP
jgi:tRNA threonylcarbamoyladenosine biosynthesis protein TsaB